MVQNVSNAARRRALKKKLEALKLDGLKKKKISVDIKKVKGPVRTLHPAGESPQK